MVGHSVVYQMLTASVGQVIPGSGDQKSLYDWVVPHAYHSCQARLYPSVCMQLCWLLPILMGKCNTIGKTIELGRAGQSSP